LNSWLDSLLPQEEIFDRAPDAGERVLGKVYRNGPITHGDPMKVLWITTFPPRRCGIGDYAAELASALSKDSGIRLRVLTYRDGLGGRSTWDDGVEVSRNLNGRPTKDHIVEEIDEFAPDLVHLQSSSFLHPAAVNRGVAKAGESVPVVTTVHNAPQSWRLFYAIPSLRKVYARSSLLIVHSTGVSRTLTGFHRIDGKKIRRIPHGVDVDRYCPGTQDEAVRARYDLGGKRIVLFFGFLRPGKGLETLLRAWRRIAEANLDAILLIAGGTPSSAKKYFLNLRDEADYPARLRQLAESLGIGRRVQFTDYVPDAIVPGLLSSAEVIVLPYEGAHSQSGPFHKALSCGRPVVATKSPAFEDVLGDGEAALLTRPGDAQALAEAIHLLLSDDQLRNKLGRRGRQLAVERLSWPRIARTTVSLYHQTVETS